MYSFHPEICKGLHTSDYGVTSITKISSSPSNKFPLTSVYRVCISRTWAKTIANTGIVGAIGLAFTLGGIIGAGILAGMVTTALTTYFGEEIDAFCCDVTISIYQDTSVRHSFRNFRRQ